MKRRQLLSWISCSRATPPTLLICIFVSPWYPKWEHVLWAQETFLCILGVSFSSFFSQFDKPLVFGVSSAHIIRKLTEFISFCNSVVKTPPRVLGLLKEWRARLRVPILGKFLSVFFYLARLWSVWCVKSNIRIWGTKYFFYCYLQLHATSTTGTWIPLEHLHLCMTCCWLARSQERAPTQSPWQVPGWTLHLTLM